MEWEKYSGSIKSSLDKTAIELKKQLGKGISRVTAVDWKKYFESGVSSAAVKAADLRKYAEGIFRGRIMKWEKHFKSAQGAGYLATCNSSGNVDIAVFAKPHIMPDGTIAFGMADRMTHANLQENPHAVYAFKENGYNGVRLFLEKVKEETEGPVLEQFRQEAKEQSPYPEACSKVKCVEYFRVTRDLPLVVTEKSKGGSGLKYFYPSPFPL